MRSENAIRVAAYHPVIRTKKWLICFSLILVLIPALFDQRLAHANEASPTSESERKPLRSLVVEKTNTSVVVRDAIGQIVREGHAGKDDAAVLQWAIDAVRPGGAVTIHTGQYVLDRTVEIFNSTEITGEGSQTIIVPPAGDFAFRLMRRENSHTDRAEIHGVTFDKTLTGLSMANFAIDGGPEGRGKGIYLFHIGQSTLQDLWILRTTEGAGIYIDQSVMEVTFSRIHLLGNGSEKTKEASVVIAAQESGDANNNLHFDNVFVIFPNYIGMEIGAGGGKEVPRLLFLNQCMFHGWLRNPTKENDWESAVSPAPFDLIRVTNLESTLGMVIRDSRLSNSGEKSAELFVERGNVKAFSSVFGGGRGGYLIRGGDSASLTVVGNTFEEVSNSGGGKGIVLEATGAGVTFEDNTMDENTGPVRLMRPTYAIVSNNIFRNPGNGRRLYVDNGNGTKSGGVLVSGNIFVGIPKAQMIEVSSPSRHAVVVKDNISMGE